MYGEVNLDRNNYRAKIMEVRNVRLIYSKLPEA